jgi:hypothetical protein
LLTEISLDEQGDDWAEAEFGVEWTTDGQLNVCATVGVACLCVQDHNKHYAVSLDVPADAVSLGEAFEAAAHQLIKWLEESRDPAYWRPRASMAQ